MAEPMHVDSLPSISIQPAPSTSIEPLQPKPSTSMQPEPTTSAQPVAGPSTGEAAHGTRSRSGIFVPKRIKIAPPKDVKNADTSRATRSSVVKPKIQATKLKLKLGDKLAAQAPGMSFLGAYDRELDSDEEELAFEEQFILRMPPGEDCDKLRKMVSSREISPDVWFKFKDSRRAHFHIGNTTYSSKLVDLPCIIESQKTLDSKQMFKVADICQMLLVEKPINSEDPGPGHRSFNIEEYVYPHGLTPPLKHVRKRRFRKRVNRRTIENVEQEVERLLGEDTLADEVQYEVLENVNPDLSDSEFIEQEVVEPAATPAAMSDTGDMATPAPGMDDDDDDEDEGDIDEELAAALDMALEDDISESGDEDSGDESGEEEDDSGDEEQSQARKLLNEEIRDLDNAVAKKEKEVASTTNPLIKKRFEDTLKKLTADLEAKRAQREDLDERARMEKDGIPEPALGVDDTAEQSGDDLFGDDEDMDLS